MSFVRRAALLGLVFGGAAVAWTSDTVPVSVQQPGTQPTEVNGFTSPGNCATCHGETANPDLEPDHGWRGSMMAHALRDGLFWATVAVAEQDFLPGSDPTARGGVGDLCLRCHGPDGWVQGLSTPTDGSGYLGKEEDGVECEMCHLLVDPDEALTVSGTTEVQDAPFEAFDPDTGEAYHGSGQYVINGNGTRLGPYDDADANHPFLKSGFHREGDLCGTCHDVSNPAVGDLAHNHGSMTPELVSSHGSLSASPGDTAAFTNPPSAYGVVERTFSEWRASALDTFVVNDYPTLPAELRLPGGALDVAFHRAYDARSDANYVDGAVRTFTCQTCHMAASTGVGCNKNNVPARADLPRHDLTGGGYWSPDLLEYQADQGTLVLGSLTTADRASLADGKVRAQEMLASAAALTAEPEADSVQVEVVNLTGHKLISGYPEGRRMWLHVVFRDGGGHVLAEHGGYGPIGRSVQDAAGISHQVQSLLDPGGTVLFAAEPGMDEQWANQLIGLGYSGDLVLGYDRLDDSPTLTLADLAATTSGTVESTFHFALNNVVTHDTRIPPYGFSYDEALARSALPVPPDQYGAPGPGGTYEHVAEASFGIPSGATSVTVRLLYQQTSWEYVQFLWLANDGLSPFLGTTGDDLLDAWLNTGQSAPFEMAAVSVTLEAPELVFSDGFEIGDLRAWSQVEGGGS